MKREFLPSLLFGLFMGVVITGGSLLITPLLSSNPQPLEPVYQLVKLSVFVVVFTLIRWKTTWMG